MKRFLYVSFSVLILGLFFCPKISSAACATQLVARDPFGRFLTGVRFEIYSQANDADGRIKPNKSLASGTSDKTFGWARLSFGGLATSTYAVKIKAQGNEAASFWYYLEDLKCNQSLQIVKYLSGIKFSFRSANGVLRKNVAFNLYTQTLDADGQPVADKNNLIGSFNTGSSGETIVYVPQGSIRSLDRLAPDVYFLEVKGANNALFSKSDIKVLDAAISEVDFYFSELKLKLKDENGMALVNGSQVEIYRQIEAGSQKAQGDKILTVSTANFGEAKAEVATGKYMVVVTPKGKPDQSYRIWDLNVNDQGVFSQGVKLDNDDIVGVGTSEDLSRRLAGRIILAVAAHGEAYYINPANFKRYYLANGAAAQNLMSRLGAGMSDANLRKIPIGLLSQVVLKDSDGDQLPDNLEVAIKTDLSNPDTDGDGYGDGLEVSGGYNPLGSGRLVVDTALANRFKGRIILQTDSHGEAWYIYPMNGKRYYLGDGENAYQIMRYLSLGVTNEDLAKIPLAN